MNIFLKIENQNRNWIEPLFFFLSSGFLYDVGSLLFPPDLLLQLLDGFHSQYLGLHQPGLPVIQFLIAQRMITVSDQKLEVERPGARLVHMVSVCACLSVCLSRFVNTVAFHPDGNCIGGGTTDSVVKVYIPVNNTNVQLCLECCGCLQNLVWFM